MEPQKYGFEIISDGEPKPIYDQTIEMSNVKTKFTINDIFDHMDFTQSKLVEAGGQMMVNQKHIEALVEKFPMLKDIPEENFAVVLQYINKKEAIKSYLELIPICNETLTNYRERLGQIVEALGIEIPERYSKDMNLPKPTVEEKPLEEAK